MVFGPRLFMVTGCRSRRRSTGLAHRSYSAGVALGYRVVYCFGGFVVFLFLLRVLTCQFKVWGGWRGDLTPLRAEFSKAVRYSPTQHFNSIGQRVHSDCCSLHFMCWVPLRGERLLRPDGVFRYIFQDGSRVRVFSLLF